MDLKHIKILLDSIEQIKWTSECLKINHSKIDAKKLKDNMWEWLKENNLEKKYKIYIGKF
jgi:hypothetical protein